LLKETIGTFDGAETNN